MILSDVETATRQDLFDPAGASQRWATTDIDRAIDKAVDRYSQVYPNILFTDMASQPFQRTYPYPTPWNASYPVWWIERILYPLQTYGSYFTPPATNPLQLTAVPGSALNIGTYVYAFTFLSQGGETTPPATLVSVNTSNGFQKVNVQNVPLGPTQPNNPSIATNTTIGRNIYRSLVGQTQLYYVGTIPDNVTTTFLDSMPDATLANQAPAPKVNTSGVMYWPPFERDFAEYSNLFDSTAALAAGGNMGVQGAAGDALPTNVIGVGSPSFTLKLSSAELPQDSTQVLRIFYATKHQLDSNGSTIPEVHRDVIVLGATAYAIEAYQVPTNDNFDFQDGALRDRVDDTKIPEAWLTLAKHKAEQFENRLQEIKRQRDFATSARVHWGDVPARWPRL